MGLAAADPFFDQDGGDKRKSKLAASCSGFRRSGDRTV